MKIKILLSLALASSPALADEYVIEVSGLVCSFCAQGVSKKVARLPFIDPAKYTRGVKVEIEDQKVTISVKDDLEPDIDALYAAIRSGGYEPVRIWLVGDDGQLTEYGQ